MEVFFSKKKRVEVPKYDVENQEPIIKSSICNGEQVAGFRNTHTGEFSEVMFIRDEHDLEEFKLRYGITGKIRKVY